MRSLCVNNTKLLKKMCGKWSVRGPTVPLPRCGHEPVSIFSRAVCWDSHSLSTVRSKSQMLKTHSGNELLSFLGWWWNKYVLVKEDWERVSKIALPLGLWYFDVNSESPFLSSETTTLFHEFAGRILSTQYDLSFFLPSFFFACTLKTAQFQNLMIMKGKPWWLTVICDRGNISSSILIIFPLSLLASLFYIFLYKTRWISNQLIRRVFLQRSW